MIAGPLIRVQRIKYFSDMPSGMYQQGDRCADFRVVCMPSDEVEFLSPSGAIKPTGPWSVGVRAGDFVFIAGMRGIDPATNTLVDGVEPRIRRAFLNMKTIAEASGATLRDAVRLVVYVTDMDRYRPVVNNIQEEMWGGAPFPPRTVVEVSRLNQDDIVEVEGTFFCPKTARPLLVLDSTGRPKAFSPKDHP